MSIVNLRIENKVYSTVTQIKERLNPDPNIFKEFTPANYKDPLFLTDLYIWVDGVLVDSSKIEYLEIIMLAGREKVTTNIKFTDSDYLLLEGKQSPDWKAKLSKYREDNKPYSFREKLFENNSDNTIIEGIPLDKDSIVTQGFDIDSYCAGLKIPPTKIKITLYPYNPLSVEVTYAPVDIAINLNTNLNISDKAPYLDEIDFKASLYSLDEVELIKFIDCKVDDIIFLERGIILDLDNINKINKQDTYIIKTKDREYFGVKLNGIGMSFLPEKKIKINSISATYTK